MLYSTETSRANPSCFLFLIDQSGSMVDDWGGEQERKKADALATIMNRMLQNLVLKCTKSEGVRDYYYVSVLGYGAQVGPALSGGLSGKELVSISEIGNMPARLEERTRRMEDGAGGLVNQTIRMPIWFDPVANGGTPMCQAMRYAKDLLERWIVQHLSCFPPLVFNITDGESTDGDPTRVAEEITSLASSDGNVLLFNIHISSQRVEYPIVFPDNEAGLPDQYAQLLFRLSSPLPTYLRGFASQEGLPVNNGSRGFVFNADMVSVISFLDIGTRPSNLR